MSPEHILRRPIALTEKATRLRNENKVVFEVATTANKVQIRHAVEVMFKVKVTSAVVSLAEGHAIDFFADETK